MRGNQSDWMQFVSNTEGQLKPLNMKNYITKPYLWKKKTVHQFCLTHWKNNLLKIHFEKIHFEKIQFEKYI